MLGRSARCRRNAIRLRSVASQIALLIAAAAVGHRHVFTIVASAPSRHRFSAAATLPKSHRKPAILGQTWQRSQFHQKPSKTARWSEDSEIERLRRENQELKQKMKEENWLQKLANGVKSFFGLGDEKKTGETSAAKTAEPLASSSTSSDLASPFSSALGLPAAFGLVGSLIRPMFSLFSGLLKSSQDDVQAVLSEAQAALLRSGRLGSRVECGPIYSQSYSSMNINGQQSAQVQLQFQAKGDGGSGMATCSARISGGGVQISDLKLDGQPVDTSSTGGGNVIDV
eukprot:TRINITY_DN23151_c0_g5_i1.p1 TRINITY_DN23151_c0_g5~~TRINITY_DN23151_c0_g5_i1.p1  ORF type:complete len:285 (-),score=64.17 TRINITY_DN23151_c0_g5_i1:71-925(-)